MLQINILPGCVFFAVDRASITLFRVICQARKRCSCRSCRPAMLGQYLQPPNLHLTSPGMETERENAGGRIKEGKGAQREREGQKCHMQLQPCDAQPVRTGQPPADEAKHVLSTVSEDCSKHRQQAARARPAQASRAEPCALWQSRHHLQGLLRYVTPARLHISGHRGPQVFASANLSN